MSAGSTSETGDVEHCGFRKRARGHYCRKCFGNWAGGNCSRRGRRAVVIRSGRQCIRIGRRQRYLRLATVSQRRRETPPKSEAPLFLPSGQVITATVHSASESESISVAATGNNISAAVASVTESGSAIVTPFSSELTATVGDTSETGTANIAATGTAAAPQKHRISEREAVTGHLNLFTRQPETGALILRCFRWCTFFGDIILQSGKRMRPARSVKAGERRRKLRPSIQR